MADIQTTKTQAQAVTLGMTEIEVRQLAEVKGKMQLAKFFPRDPEAALNSVLAQCSNIKLAETAIYSFPRGDSEVKGASIRLVEVIAGTWGNLTFGVTELDRREGESTVKAYAWDLETNVSDEKVFSVSHTRITKRGNYALTDPRDIYELVMNQAQRRKRACILSLIPQHVVDLAMDTCEKSLTQTLKGKNISDIRNEMAGFFSELDERITPAEIAAKVGKDFDKLGANDIVRLKRLYSAIKDGFVKPEAAFGFSEPAPAEIDPDVQERSDAIFGITREKPADTDGQEVTPAGAADAADPAGSGEGDAEDGKGPADAESAEAPASEEEAAPGAQNPPVSEEDTLPGVPLPDGDDD